METAGQLLCWRLKMGKDLAEKDSWTAVMLASGNGHLEVTGLVESGAEMDFA